MPVLVIWLVIVALYIDADFILFASIVVSTLALLHCNILYIITEFERKNGEQQSKIDDLKRELEDAKGKSNQSRIQSEPQS